MFVRSMDSEIDKRIKEHGYGNDLYHYTSIPVVYSILKNREFWFGNTATMNDSSEVKYFVEQLKNELEKNIPPEKRIECDELFSKALRNIEKEYPYAMCFSKLEDDAAQWERYADDAKGVCIVFNTKNIMKIFYNANFLFNDVYYDYDIKKHRHYTILHEYFTHGNWNSISSKDGQLENIIACAYLHKHRSFRSEQEIRVVNLWGKIPDNAEAKTECIGGVIKKVMKLNVSKCCKDAGLLFEDLFDGIIIGPRSHQDVKSLQAFVEEEKLLKLKDKISKSDCPLQ